MFRIRTFSRFFGSLSAILSICAVRAEADTLSVTLDLSSLPATVVECRDQTAVALYNFDELWQVAIDVDGNSNTGDQGVDVLLDAYVAPPSIPCSPTTVTLANNLQVDYAVWDSGSSSFVESGITPTVSLSGSTMTLTVPLSGPLGNLSSQAVISVSAGASYTQTSSSPALAQDNVSAIGPNGSASDASHDVSSCSAPCSTSASYYPLIDLVGASATTSVPTSDFGSHTLFIEFDVAALHSTIGVCRYPSAFTAPGLVDSEWIAQFNPSGQDNGDANGGFDTVVLVYTPQQSAPCGTQSLDTVSALSAGLFTVDGNGNLAGGTALPISVDVPNGKIVVQADTSVAEFAGFSNNSLVTFGTSAIYGPNVGTFDSISTGPFTIAFGSVTDPTSDLQSCVTPCATSDAWYQEIDLKQVSVARPNEIFQNGFE